MTITGLDPDRSRRPHRTTGLLAPFVEATVLESADVHVATTLGRLARSGGARNGGASGGGASGEGAGGNEGAGPVDELTVLAAALAVRAVRLGSVLVDLRTIAGTATVDDGDEIDLTILPWPDPGLWLDAVRASPLVAAGDDGPVDRPLRLVGDTVALDRYWRHERAVVTDLAGRAGSALPDVNRALLTEGLRRLFPEDPPDPHQQLAAACAVMRTCSVIAGGPGTGKTTTVARILALLHEQAGGRALRVALAAPTGKAAARLQESVQAQVAALDVTPSVAAAVGAVEASTLHRLLGFNPGNRSRFRHDRANQLPHEVVIVDETSMVSLSMMARLLEAVRPTARLVLVGDPQQLSSVEAGAVLGDVVGPAADSLVMRPEARAELAAVTGLTVDAAEDHRPVSIGDGIVVLRTVHRFDGGGGVGRLARAVESGDADAVVDVLRDAPDVTWLPVDVADGGGDATPDRRAALEAVRDRVVTQATAVIGHAQGGDAAAALSSMRRVQLLCAHRRGPYGVATWRREIERRLAETVPGFAHHGWFAGRPLLVTENDRHLQLYNGDTGVVVEVEDRLRCAFERRGEVVLVSPSRLAAVETLYAMTIHKSQGSQFREVVVVLPDESSPILTRELLYTAVTRAESSVTVVGTEAAVRTAVARPVTRASGLRARLWDDVSW